MYKHSGRKQTRNVRHLRLRKKVSGTSERPRLSVYRSLRHISAQLIDDVAGVTLASATTNGKDAKEQFAGKKKLEKAALIGRQVAEKASAAGIMQAVFDRGGNAYHGRVKALCEAAREAGLEI